MKEAKRLYSIGIGLECILLIFKVMIDIYVMNYSMAKVAWDTIFFAAGGIVVGWYLGRFTKGQMTKFWAFAYAACIILILVSSYPWLEVPLVIEVCIGRILSMSSIFLFSLLFQEQSLERKKDRYLLLLLTCYGAERALSLYDINLFTSLTVLGLAIYAYRKKRLVGKEDLAITTFVISVLLLDELRGFISSWKYRWYHSLLENRFKILKSGLLGTGNHLYREECHFSKTELLGFISEECGFAGLGVLFLLLSLMVLFSVAVYRAMPEGFFGKFTALGICIHWSSNIVFHIACNFISPSVFPMMLFAENNLNLAFFFIEFSVLLWLLNICYIEQNSPKRKGRSRRNAYIMQTMK